MICSRTRVEPFWLLYARLRKRVGRKFPPQRFGSMASSDDDGGASAASVASNVPGDVVALGATLPYNHELPGRQIDSYPLPDTVEYVSSDDEPVVLSESVQQWLERDRDQHDEQTRSRSPPVILPVAESQPVAAMSRPSGPGSSSFSVEAMSRPPGLGSSSSSVEAMSPPPGLRVNPAWRDDNRARSRLLTNQWDRETGGCVWARLAPSSESWPTGVVQFCRSTIATQAGSFYIGITEDPLSRWYGRDGVPGHCRAYSYMIVLYEARSSSSTATLERLLIAHYHEPGFLRCLNVGRGGERASAGSPHYLYVAFRQDVLIRRFQ